MDVLHASNSRMNQSSKSQSRYSMSSNQTINNSKTTDFVTSLKPLRPRMRIKRVSTVQDHDPLMACTVGDMAWLHQSIRHRRPLDESDKEGMSTIHLAALNGHLPCLRVLIEKQKIDVNTTNSRGWTPLHFAINNQCGNRSLECVQYLLKMGADPSRGNKDGLTPAHITAICGNVDCLKELVAANAIINAEDKNGHTPLFLARLWANRECMRILDQEQWKLDKADIIMENRFRNKLRALEREDHMLAEEDEEKERQFYGSLAFHDWMEKKKFDMKPYMFGPNANRKQQDSEDVSALNLLMLDKALEQIDSSDSSRATSRGKAVITKHSKRLAKQKQALANQRDRLLENIARERRKKKQVVSKATGMIVIHPDSDEELEKMRKSEEEEKARFEELKKRTGPRSIFSRLAQPKNGNDQTSHYRFRQLKLGTRSMMQIH